MPAQALLGGITVLTDLNPWVVAFHLLFSMGIISLAVLYLWRIDHPVSPGTGPLGWRALAWTTYAVAWVVLALGTIVTGSGPHAGDAKAPRNGLDPLQISQAHADAVFLFIGLSLGLLVALRAPGPAAVVRAAFLLVVVELAQGLIGFVQYFTDLPIVLVEFHLLGAALIAAVSTWMLIAVSGSVSAPVRTRGEVSL